MSKQVNCPDCVATFSRKDHMKRHWRTKHQEAQVSCTVCGETFSRPDKAIQHAKMHTVVRDCSRACTSKKIIAPAQTFNGIIKQEPAITIPSKTTTMPSLIEFVQDRTAAMIAEYEAMKNKEMGMKEENMDVVSISSDEEVDLRVAESSSLPQDISPEVTTEDSQPEKPMLASVKPVKVRSLVKIPRLILTPIDAKPPGTKLKKTVKKTREEENCRRQLERALTVKSQLVLTLRSEKDSLSIELQRLKGQLTAALDEVRRLEEKNANLRERVKQNQHTKEELTVLKQKHNITQIRLKELEQELNCAREAVTKTVIVPKKITTFSEVIPKSGISVPKVIIPHVDMESTNEPDGVEVLGGTFDDLLGGLEDMPSIWLEDDE